MTMKKIYLFISLSLSLSMLLGLTACSSDDSMSVPQVVKTENGFYVQKVNFICEAPSYDQGTTRAVTYDWKSGTSLFARFKSDSKYYIGYISYESDGWTMISTTEFIELTASGTCELYYFLEPNGDYYHMNLETGCLDIYNNGSSVKNTDIAWNASSINMTECTAVYATTTATYSKEKGKGWTIKATLSPMMWRMRFSGSNGTSISMPGSDNDIKYVSAFNWSTSSVSFSMAEKDVSLSVNGSYTPYIYGVFNAPSSDNKITVKNGSDTYTRTFNGSNLKAGRSGYFTIPTTSNYSSNGWTLKESIDTNATIQPDYLVTFTDGLVTNWKFGSTANIFAYTVLSKPVAESLSDEELTTRVFNDGRSYTVADSEGYIFRFVDSSDDSSIAPNTNYYLCAVAKNSSGKRGPVLRYLFKTNATSLPYAEISNVAAATSTKWTCDVALKNGAQSYYIFAWTGENAYNTDWHYIAYWAREDVDTGTEEAIDWTGVSWTLSSGTCDYFSVCTWGVASNGSIGNPHVAYGNVSSSAPHRATNITGGKLQKEAISKKNLEKMMEGIKLYRITNE